MTSPSLNGVIEPLEHVAWPCVPFADESLMGFLTRTADYNAIHDPRMILREVGYQSHRAYTITRSNHPLSGLATLLNVDVEWLETVRHRVVSHNKSKGPQYVDFHGVILSDRHLDYGSRMVSSFDLRKGAYHRESWYISTLPISQSSWEFLISNCPSCARPLKWVPAWGIGRCNWPDCLSDLTESEGKTIPSDWRPGLQVCADLISSDVGIRTAARLQLDPALQDTDFGALFELAWNLGCLEDEDFAAALAHPKSVSLERRSGIIARGGAMILTWPQSFADWIKATISDGIDSNMLQERLARIRRIAGRLSALDLQGPIAVLRQAMFWGPGQHSTRSMLTGIGFVSRWTVQHETPIGKNSLQKLEDAGVLETYRGKVGHAKTLFPSDSIEKIQNAKREYISVRQASREIGISIDGLTSLIDSGLLRQSEDPIAVCLWGKDQVLRTSLEGLLGVIRTKVGNAEGQDDLVRLKIAMRGYPGSSKPWASLLRDVSEGTIALFSWNSDRIKMQECAIQTSDCARLQRLPLTMSQQRGEGPDWIPEYEIYERLNCGWKQVRALIREGLIQPSNRSRGQTFSRSQIDALGQSLVHPTELRVIFGRHAKSPIDGFVSILAKGGVQPNAAGFFDRAKALSLLRPQLTVA